MILLYASERTPVAQTLEEIVAEQMPYRRLMHFRSLKALEQGLRRPRAKVEILLICIADAIEMRQLSDMRPLLLNLCLVLVLPEQDTDTVAWARKLSPRFIAYADSGLDQVRAVLEKMALAQKVVPLKAVRPL